MWTFKTHSIPLSIADLLKFHGNKPLFEKILKEGKLFTNTAKSTFKVLGKVNYKFKFQE